MKKSHKVIAIIALLSVVTALLVLVVKEVERKKNMPPPEIAYKDIEGAQKEVDRLELKDELTWQETYQLALAYFHVKDNEKAIEKLEEVIKLRPQFVKSYETLGMAFLKNGENDKAVAIWNQAIEKGSTQEHLKELVGKIRIKTESKKRITQLEEELKNKDLKPDMIYGKNAELGILYMAINDFDKALKIYKNLEKKRSKDYTVAETLMQLYAYKNDFDNARKYARKAVKINPESKELMEKYLAEMDRLEKGMENMKAPY